MALYSDLPVSKASYDLVLDIFGLVRNFNREYKYTLGEDLKREILNLVILIYRANSREDKGVVIAEARERVELIRLLIRLVKDLQQINLKLCTTVVHSIVNKGNKKENRSIQQVGPVLEAFSGRLLKSPPVPWPFFALGL